MTADANRDSDVFPLRVTRSIPVWAIISALGAMVVQAVSLQLGQVRQGELIAEQSKKIVEQSVSIKELSLKIEGISDKAQEARFKGANYEFRFDELDRRINALERGRKP